MAENRPVLGQPAGWGIGLCECPIVVESGHLCILDELRPDWTVNHAFAYNRSH